MTWNIQSERALCEATLKCVNGIGFWPDKIFIGVITIQIYWPEVHLFVSLPLALSIYLSIYLPFSLFQSFFLIASFSPSLFVYLSLLCISSLQSYYLSLFLFLIWTHHLSYCSFLFTQFLTTRTKKLMQIFKICRSYQLWVKFQLPNFIKKRRELVLPTSAWRYQ